MKQIDQDCKLLKQRTKGNATDGASGEARFGSSPVTARRRMRAGLKAMGLQVPGRLGDF
jgi:hypothetical protein